MTAVEGAERARMLEEALAHSWYHTLELAPGRPTNGSVDLRPVAPKVLPDSLAGLRALDVGTFDGFWAFELERRGAEVVATDLDRFDAVEWPPPKRARLAQEAGDRGPGERFGLAKTLLGSEVRRVTSSVYDLDPAVLGGPVDFAVVGDLLLHLRDPVRGLERVAEALSPGGRVLVMEQVNVPLSLLCPRSSAADLQASSTSFNWWEPNLRCLRDWLALAGFRGAHRRAVYRLRARGAQRRWHAALEAERAGPGAPAAGGH